MAIERYRTIAPELFTIKPTKNKVLHPKSIENNAYGLCNSALS